MLRQAVAWVVEVIALFVLWFLFTGELSRHECIAGAGAALLATVGAHAALMQIRSRFRPRPSWLLDAWRLPWLIVAGTWVLAQRLGQHLARRRPPKGLFMAVPFDVGGNDPRSAARRALAILYTTLPPNFVIIDMDRDTGLMLFHQVRKDPVPEITKRLGAR